MKNKKNSKCQVRKWKIFFFQIQCQVYRNDPSQILYNFDFFLRELQFFSFFDELSTEMKNQKNSKCQVRKWKKIPSKFNVKYIEMIPVKFSKTLIFSSWNFNFFNFWWTVHRDAPKNTFFGIFKFFWEKFKKISLTKVMRNFNTVILSHLRGRYDLRCGWGNFNFFNFRWTVHRDASKTRFWAFLNFSGQNRKKCILQKLCGISLRSF